MLGAKDSLWSKPRHTGEPGTWWRGNSQQHFSFKATWLWAGLSRLCAITKGTNLWWAKNILSPQNNYADGPRWHSSRTSHPPPVSSDVAFRRAKDELQNNGDVTLTKDHGEMSLQFYLLRVIKLSSKDSTMLLPHYRVWTRAHIKRFQGSIVI